MISKSLKLGALKELALEVGLSLTGVTEASVLHSDLEKLSTWQTRGFAGEMGYMERDPELLSSPHKLLPECKTILSFALQYDSSPHPERSPGFGRVARYAWGRDYHKVFPKLLSEFLGRVTKKFGVTPKARVFADAVPLLERAVAARSGYGFIGKNTLFISPGYGSFTVLGEILWDLEVESEKKIITGCGSCTKCLSACPTGALVSERSLDSRKCISYLTIEKRGELEISERKMIGDWLFGCDLCQEICPYNHTSIKLKRRGFEELQAKRGVGPLLSLKELLEIRTNEQFIKRFAGTALMRTKREGLLRNACIVSANTKTYELKDTLLQVSQEDSSEIVRAQALAAYFDLAAERELAVALDHSMRDVLRVKSKALKILEERC